MIDWFDQDSITGLLKHKGNVKDGSDGIKTIVLTHEMNYCYSVGSQNYNSIGCYSRNKETGDLTFISKLVTCARVLTISADDNNLYLPTTEFDIQWFDRDVKTGELKFKNKIKDNVNGVDGLEFASDLSFDPDGRMLYVTAEYDSSIAWFLRNELTGDLEFKGCIKSSSCNAPFLAGATALAISPDGKNVYITSSYNSTIAWCSVTETNIVDVGKKGSAGNVYLRNGNLSLQLLTAVKSGLIRVFDTRGKLLNSFNLKNLNAGKHVFPILKNKIAAGSFFVELTIENHKQILPFINIR
jgi:WD40 repeat protein